jgi:hypothetical protein
MPAIVCNAKCNLQQEVPKKAELDSECLCFDKFPEGHFELAAKLQTEKLPGDLQNAEYLFLTGFQFRQEFLLLQLKFDLLVGEIMKMLHIVLK